VTAAIANPLETASRLRPNWALSGFTKNRECIDEQRAEARHHAEARGQHNTPAVIFEIEFTQGGRESVALYGVAPQASAYQFP